MDSGAGAGGGGEVVPLAAAPADTGTGAPPEPANVHLHRHRHRLLIYKTKPTLGIAIEGGADTGQSLPRVINIQPNGAAYESGGLKLGHVILEVNGKPLAGLDHHQAAQTLSLAFSEPRTDSIELLVTEQKDRPITTTTGSSSVPAAAAPPVQVASGGGAAGATGGAGAL